MGHILTPGLEDTTGFIGSGAGFSVHGYYSYCELWGPVVKVGLSSPQKAEGLNITDVGFTNKYCHHGKALSTEHMTRIM